MRIPLVLIISSLVVGCGGSNPGGGTKTLWVNAEAVTDGSTEGSRMAIEVRNGSNTGDIITDAQVRIRGDRSGEFFLTWEGIKFGTFAAGAYLKSGLAWDRNWSIEVIRGNDRLDAAIEAPGVSTLTEPISDTTFRRSEGKPLAVRWKDAEGRRAEVTQLTLDKANFDRTFTDDPYAFDVEPNNLVAADRERVTLVRTNQVELAGGTPGSMFKAQSRHTITLRVE